MNARKLDYITDKAGFISMVIFNSHPGGHVFIAPKYFPHPDGTWSSRDPRERPKRYHRFEYYWNLKQDGKANGQGMRQGNNIERVYEVDKNPQHDYDLNVHDIFNKHLVQDPCHGVPMYCLPVDEIEQYHDARAFYNDVIASPPAWAARYEKVLGTVRSSIRDEDLGITGSYLYGIYQDFSDLNLVVYNGRALPGFHQVLLDNGGLLGTQEIEVLVPGSMWQGWKDLHNAARWGIVLGTSRGFETKKFHIKDRFIGSIHDPNDNDTRIGFWTVNTRDKFQYGTFTKKVVGTGLIHAAIHRWNEGMASGCFELPGITVLGYEPRGEGAVDGRGGTSHQSTTTPEISRLQIIGEFNRMFLFDEEIAAFGLVQETVIKGRKRPEYELLVGGREFGGWVLPASIFSMTQQRK